MLQASVQINSGVFSPRYHSLTKFQNLIMKGFLLCYHDVININKIEQHENKAHEHRKLLILMSTFFFNAIKL